MSCTGKNRMYLYAVRMCSRSIRCKRANAQHRMRRRAGVGEVYRSDVTEDGQRGSQDANAPTGLGLPMR